MHECPFCGEFCYCDLDDTGGLPVPDDCPHVCADPGNDDSFEEMRMSGKTQWVSEKKALSLVWNKPCRICGAPACCAVRDNGIAPVCETHGRIAQKLGYIVVFPDDEEME